MAKLSYKKFSKLLLQNGYLISLIYYIENNGREVVFFELRLPKSQKTIILYISPNKYTMLLPKEVNYKTIEIVSTEDERVKSAAFILTERSLHYAIGVRGPLVESDIVIISSNGVCYTKFNGENYCYFMADKVKKLGENDKEILKIEESENSEEEEIALLEKNIKNIAKKKGVQLKEFTVQKGNSAEISIKTQDVKKEVVVKNKKTDAYIKKPEEIIVKTEEKKEEDVFVSDENDVKGLALEFVEKSGSSESVVDEEDSEEEYSFDSSSETNSSEDVEEKELTTKIINPSTSNKSNTKASPMANYVMPEVLDIYHGAVYVGTDINTFYKNVGGYEPEALAIYEQIEDNETDIRMERLNDTKKKLGLLSVHVESRVKDIELEELGLKYQLLRLTGILHNVDTLKNKNINSKNIGNAADSNLSELNRIYEKTRKTVHDINLQLLQKREEYEDILSNCEYTIAELLEL